MGISRRMFLLDQNDRIFRLATAKFARMLTNPAAQLFRGFAGQPLRAAEVLVELHGRAPTRILSVNYTVLSFDDAGCFDCRI